MVLLMWIWLPSGTKAPSPFEALRPYEWNDRCSTSSSASAETGGERAFDLQGLVRTGRRRRCPPTFGARGQGGQRAASVGRQRDGVTEKNGGGSQVGY